MRDRVDHYGYPVGRGERDFSSSDLAGSPGRRSRAPAAQRWEFLRQTHGPQDVDHQEEQAPRRQGRPDGARRGDCKERADHWMPLPQLPK